MIRTFRFPNAIVRDGWMDIPRADDGAFLNWDTIDFVTENWWLSSNELTNFRLQFRTRISFIVGVCQRRVLPPPTAAVLATSVQNSLLRQLMTPPCSFWACSSSHWQKPAVEFDTVLRSLFSVFGSRRTSRYWQQQYS